MANDASFFALRDALRTLRDLLPKLGSGVLPRSQVKAVACSGLDPG